MNSLGKLGHFEFKQFDCLNPDGKLTQEEIDKAINNNPSLSIYNVQPGMSEEEFVKANERKFSLESIFDDAANGVDNENSERSLLNAEYGSINHKPIPAVLTRVSDLLHKISNLSWGKIKE